MQGHNAFLLAAALLAMPTAAASDDETCDQQVRGSLYSAELTEEDSRYFEVYRDWLCTQTFTTHSQAAAEGLGAASFLIEQLFQ